MVLAYHNIVDNPNDYWAVAPRQFEEDMRYLAENGYVGVSLVDYMRSGSTDNLIALTFDDGYSDYAYNAVPILSKYGFGSTAFVVVGCVGGKSTWRRESLQSPLMSWNNIRELSYAGHEIGSHGMMHSRLVDLNSAERCNDIHESKAVIESKIGKKINGFSYPWCLYSLGVMEAVKNARYGYAVAGNNGCEDRYALRRIGVHRNDTLRSIVPCRL